MRTAQGGCDSNYRLEFDPDTGKLGTRKLKTEPDHAIYTSLSEGFFASRFGVTPGKESIRILEASEGIKYRCENDAYFLPISHV